MRARIAGRERGIPLGVVLLAILALQALAVVAFFRFASPDAP